LSDFVLGLSAYGHQYTQLANPIHERFAEAVHGRESQAIEFGT